MELIDYNQNIKLLNTNHGKFIVDITELIGNFLLLLNEFAPLEINIMKKLLKSDSNIIEIGANIGTHTIPIAKHITNGIVYSFEPQNIIYKQLNTNLFINQVFNVKTFNYGVGNKDETLFYTPAKFNTGEVALSKSGSHSVKVKPLTCLKYPTIDLIKIDVEGMGLDVLKGIETIIQRDKPSIFIEYRLETIKEMMQFLKPYDYNIYLANYSLLQYPNLSNVKNIHLGFANMGDYNLIAVHSNKINEFPFLNNQIKIEEWDDTYISTWIYNLEPLQTYKFPDTIPQEFYQIMNKQ